MNRSIRMLLGTLLAALASFGAQAQTCTQTISPGTDLTAAAAALTPGQTLCLNPGTYAPPNPGFPANGAFALGNGVTIRGLGATPAATVLQSTSNDHGFYFTNYLNVGGKSVNNSALINVTIQGSKGGIQIFNFTNLPAGRPTNIRIKDVVINTPAVGCCFGVYAQSADQLVLDNVTVTSYQTALNLIDVTDSLVMNSTITNTGAANAAGLALIGGSGNRFIGNTFGQPKTGSTYSFNGGGLVFYNTSENRFENNLVQGAKDDAVDFTVLDLATLGNPAGVTLTPSLNNYVGKNTVIHTALSEGRVLGASGIWSNCSSNGTWIYGNTATGTAECGVCVWLGKSNMVLGNTFSNNGIVGSFVSGGNETLEFCTAGANSFRQKPNNNYVLSNANTFNVNDQMVIRNSDNTLVARNFASPRAAFGGPAQTCINANCQSAWSVETDSSAPTYTPAASPNNTGTKLVNNTSVENNRGLWADSTATGAIEMRGNRVIGPSLSFFNRTSATTLDGGANLGGNFWTQHSASGNPSASTPYSGVLDSVSSTTGLVVDRFPYQSENLGRGYGFTSIPEPRAGALVAAGTKRTVRWDAPGCVWIDFDLDGTTSLLAGAPNTGYAIVTIPSGTSAGSHNIRLTCRDAAGTSRGTANSSNFTVTSNTLKLVSPGRDDTFNANQSLWVSWTNTNNANASVSVDYSTDGGANWSSLTTISSISTSNPVTSTRVTLPATVTNRGMIRVRSGGTLGAPGTIVDETDGWFAVRGGSGALTNVSPGTNYAMGQVYRLEWTSPANSKLVTITAAVGGNQQVIADIPDRGHFDWIPSDLGPGALTLTLQFKQINGTNIGAAVVNAVAGNTRYPTNITFGTPPTINPPGNGTLTATTNSGAAVTLTSSTPSVCTVSGNTVTGVANGTCTITGNAPASGNFLVAPASVISFAIGQTQTITFTLPTYIAVGTTYGLNGTASSGLTVTYTSQTPSVCSVSGTNLSGVSAGACTVTASQPGNGSFAAAQPVQRSTTALAPANLPRLANISTRMQVLTGDNVLIGGLVIGGTQPKTVVIRASGPSLIPFGITNALANPVLTLFSGPTPIDSNDNWQSHPNAALVQSSGFAPANALESAIYTTLNPGAYTAIVNGSGNGTGVGIVEVFEVNNPQVPLINIATRGQVLTGNDVMIAGFIIQGTQPQTVVVRARGPSLAAAGVPSPLGNPKLELYSGQTIIASNDNWQTAANQATLASLGLAPADSLESAILITLNPGAYTAVVSGSTGGTGVAIVEVFGLQ